MTSQFNKVPELTKEDIEYNLFKISEKKRKRLINVISFLFLALFMYGSYKRTGNFLEDVFTNDPLTNFLIFIATAMFLMTLS